MSPNLSEFSSAVFRHTEVPSTKLLFRLFAVQKNAPYKPLYNVKASPQCLKVKRQGSRQEPDGAVANPQAGDAERTRLICWRSPKLCWPNSPIGVRRSGVSSFTEADSEGGENGSSVCSAAAEKDAMPMTAAATSRRLRYEIGTLRTCPLALHDLKELYGKPVHEKRVVEERQFSGMLFGAPLSVWELEENKMRGLRIGMEKLKKIDKGSEKKESLNIIQDPGRSQTAAFPTPCYTSSCLGMIWRDLQGLVCTWSKVGYTADFSNLETGEFTCLANTAVQLQFSKWFCWRLYIVTSNMWIPLHKDLDGMPWDRAPKMKDIEAGTGTSLRRDPTSRGTNWGMMNPKGIPLKRLIKSTGTDRQSRQHQIHQY
ncbi:hypothetical protein K438DRAFT_1749593 [Mycena galopus ATCC 62051]|nr:hypothetical protein K438DRAFT_1749593 [Mycena galopus ATCC 62051]